MIYMLTVINLFQYIFSSDQEFELVQELAIITILVASVFHSCTEWGEAVFVKVSSAAVKLILKWIIVSSVNI